MKMKFLLRSKLNRTTYVSSWGFWGLRADAKEFATRKEARAFRAKMYADGVRRGINVVRVGK